MDRKLIAGAGPELYRTLLESMTDGVSLSTQDGIIVYTNSAEDRLFGYERGELIGQHVSVQNAYPAEENVAIVAAVIAELQQRGHWRGEWQNRKKDGTAFTTSASIIAVDFQGEPHFLCVQHDVTEARRTQLALAESRMRLDLATQAAEIGVWDWDVQTNRMVYSERAKAIYGFAPDAPVTFEQVRDATHPEDLPQTSAQARRALDPALRDRSPYEYRIVRPDGATRWLLAHGQAVFADGSGPATRYVGTIQDITERKQTAEALQASETRLKLALHAGRLAVWEYRAATDSALGSPELYEFLGFPTDREVPLSELRSRYAPGQQEALRAAGRAALERGDTFMEAEVKYVLPGGIDRWALLRADFIFPPGATSPDLLGVLVDITERKRAEDNLRLLVDELNHRVKNTLAVVQSISAQTLSESADPADAHRRFQSRIQALAGAHDILTARYWAGADLSEVVAASLRPHVGDGSPRLVTCGPSVSLPPRLAISLAMILHELATNALKYGALSTGLGSVHLNWTVEQSDAGRRLFLTWKETGGPAVRPPSRRGFGTRFIERSLAAEPAGSASLVYRPEGVECAIRVELGPEAAMAD